MRVVHSGNSRYVLFRTSRDDGKLHRGDVMSCLTVYASPEKVAKHFGYYVPDNSTPLGSFVYTDRLGVYVDPRAVTDLGPKKP